MQMVVRSTFHGVGCGLVAYATNQTCIVLSLGQSDLTNRTFPHPPLLPFHAVLCSPIASSRPVLALV